MAGTTEQLFKPAFRGQPSIGTSLAGVTQGWAGRTTIVSGSATVVYSTTLVDSDSLVFVTGQSPTAASSGFARTVEVKSINPGVAVVFGTADGVAPRAAGTEVMFAIFRSKLT